MCCEWSPGKLTAGFGLLRIRDRKERDTGCWIAMRDTSFGKSHGSEEESHADCRGTRYSAMYGSLAEGGTSGYAVHD
jgi:hypothetical protein